MSRAMNKLEAACHEYGFDQTSVDAFVEGANWADSNPNWISVEEELPANNSLVLIKDEFSSGFYTAYYLDDSKTWRSWETDRELHHVTHWMDVFEP
jgi:hypothetical protein